MVSLYFGNFGMASTHTPGRLYDQGSLFFVWKHSKSHSKDTYETCTRPAPLPNPDTSKPLQIRLHHAPNTISRHRPRVLMQAHTEEWVQRFPERVGLSGPLKRVRSRELCVRPHVRKVLCGRTCTRRQCAHSCWRASNRRQR